MFRNDLPSVNKTMGYVGRWDVCFTLISLSNLSVRIMKPDVHGRSLGECPEATTRTFRPSSRASCRIQGICSSSVGRKTDEGVHAKARPQLENLERGWDGGRVIGASRSRKAKRLGLIPLTRVCAQTEVLEKVLSTGLILM